MTKTMSIRMIATTTSFSLRSRKKSAATCPGRARPGPRGESPACRREIQKGRGFPGQAAALAGLPVGQMMTILAEFGVESRIEKEDYLQGVPQSCQGLVSGRALHKRDFASGSSLLKIFPFPTPAACPRRRFRIWGLVSSHCFTPPPPFPAAPACRDTGAPAEPAPPPEDSAWPGPAPISPRFSR